MMVRALALLSLLAAGLATPTAAVDVSPVVRRASEQTPLAASDAVQDGPRPAAAGRALVRQEVGATGEILRVAPDRTGGGPGSAMELLRRPWECPSGGWEKFVRDAPCQCNKRCDHYNNCCGCYPEQCTEGGQGSSNGPSPVSSPGPPAPEQLTVLQFSPHYECLDPKSPGDISCRPKAIDWFESELKHERPDFANFVSTKAFNYSPPDAYKMHEHWCKYDRVVALYDPSRWQPTGSSETGCHYEPKDNDRAWILTPFESVPDGEAKLLVVNSHFPHIESKTGWDLKNAVRGLGDKIKAMIGSTGIKNVVMVADTNHKKDSAGLFKALNVPGTAESTRTDRSTCCLSNPNAGPYDRVIANFGKIETEYPLEDNFEKIETEHPWTAVNWSRRRDQDRRKPPVHHRRRNPETLQGPGGHDVPGAFHMPIIARITSKQ